MNIRRKRVTLLLLMTALCVLPALIGNREVLAQSRVEHAIYYQTLNRLKQNQESMTIYVGSKQFTITKETPVLFKRAQKLLKKKVQIIYNKKNYQVINIFSDFRQTPR